MSEYEATLRALYALAGRGIVPGLERVRAALDRLGRPQDSFDVLHIAGTNGKGSVTAMAAAMLGAARFTSPHLHTFTERIWIDGPCAREEVVEAWRALGPAHELTFFEAATVMAFHIFAARGVRLAVVETGLGGRLDATNVVSPIGCAITRIDKDHEAWLGSSLEQIAREKAGILKPGVGVVIAPQSPSVTRLLESAAGALGCPVWPPPKAGRAPPFPGPHQRENLGVALGLVAIAEAHGHRANPDALEGLTWPGRLETIGGVLLDAAHNPSGAEALAKHLAQLGGPPRTLVFGAMHDKAWPAMLEALRPHVDRAIYLRPAMKRAEEPARFQEVLPGEVAISAAHALELAGAAPTLVCGSIFVLAAVRAELLGLEQDPPIAM